MPLVDQRGEPVRKQVRVSVASMFQRFHGCEPGYIRDVCHAKCCDAPTRPTGTFITIHSSEEAAIRARGATVDHGLLVTPDRVCPFKDEACLCSLHHTPDKPFGCIASPFTLNAKDCLIVRNRYRMLPCYEGPTARLGLADDERWPPAYVAFRTSLNRIFGMVEAERLCYWLDNHDAGDASFIAAWMPDDTYRMLIDNDHTRKSAESTR